MHFKSQKVIIFFSFRISPEKDWSCVKEIKNIEFGRAENNKQEVNIYLMN